MERCGSDTGFLFISRSFLRKHPINFKNAGKVALAGMSDGAQDHLYLALRLASLEKFSANGEPLPFAERP